MQARIRWIAVGAAILTLVLGYAALNRAVTIIVDGESIRIATRAFTVGGALKDADVLLNAEDRVEPAGWFPATDGMEIKIYRASLVHLVVNGKTYTARTAEKNPASLLDTWSLQLNEGDRLLVAGRTLRQGKELPQVAYLDLELRRPVEITLTDEGQQIVFESSALTLGEAIAEEGIELFSADRVEPKLETVVNGPLSATITRAQPLTIIMGTDAVEVRTAASTVGEALADANISLQGLDRSQPDEDQPIPADRRIRVIRINETLELEQHLIPHGTDWQEDSEAALDTISVILAGQDGVSASRVRIRYEDGEEVSRSEEASRVLVEARNQINGYGSQIVLQTTVVDGQTIEYYRAVTVFTTWYSPCNSGTSSCLNGTSSGLPVQRGTVATYLDYYRALKFATVYIPGYGFATIGDNNGSLSNGREPWFDLAFSEAEVAAAGGNPWSNQTITIYFTTPLPSYIPPVWPPG